jgi:hypothetical protein
VGDSLSGDGRRLGILRIDENAMIDAFRTVLTRPAYLVFACDGFPINEDFRVVSVHARPEFKSFDVTVESESLDPIPCCDQIPLLLSGCNIELRVQRIYWLADGSPVCDEPSPLSIEQICRDVLEQAMKDGICGSWDKGAGIVPEDMQSLTSGDLTGVANLLVDRIRRLRKVSDPS